MHKKIIFLDHDGVVCLSNDWGSRSKKIEKWFKEHGKMEITNVPASVRFDNFDKKAIKVLNRVLEVTDAEIVISSDWKELSSLEGFREMYKSYGVIKSPISITPNLRDFDHYTSSLFTHKGWLERARCLEIKRWLELNPTENWVSVDDLNLSNEYLNPGLDNFVHTPRSSEGIKQSGVEEKIIKILNK